VRVGAILLVLAALTAAGGAQARSRPETCEGPLAFEAAAERNAASLTGLEWSPFGRPETGWETYAPKIADEIRTGCTPQTAGFARALARWQRRNHLAAGGQFDPATFEALKSLWQGRRPFVAIRKEGACPDAPDFANLAAAAPEESDGGKIILLRAGALAAYRRMVAAAQAAVLEAGADPEQLMLFSGFRAPADDAARCEAEANCNGLVRAQCSAHRTGLAVDIVLGAAPGFSVDASADANRLWQTRTATYLWLVANARRYGFVNYVFEPWHWEWVGEAP
jgi:hypothetical protein